VFCFQTDERARFKEISTEQCQEVISSLASRGARNLMMMGAETLTRKDVPVLLDHARRIGYERIGIATNATLLSRPGRLEALLAAGLNFIEISMHAADDVTSKNVTGRSTSLRHQLEALKRIEALGAAHGLIVMFNIVVCRENLSTVVEVPRLVKERFPGINATFRFKALVLDGRAAEMRSAFPFREFDAEGLAEEVNALGVDMLFENFPLCRLGRYAHRTVEVASLLGTESYFHHQDDGEYRHVEGYSGGRHHPLDPCSRCPAEAICPSIHDRYVDLYGTTDFSPLDRSPKDLVQRFADEVGAGDELRTVAARRITELEQFSRQPVRHSCMEIGPLRVGDELIPGWAIEQLRIKPPYQVSTQLTDSSGATLELFVWPAGEVPQQAWFVAGGLGFSHAVTTLPAEPVTALAHALAARLAPEGEGDRTSDLVRWITEANPSGTAPGNP